MPPDLSSRERFLATGVEPETCNICLEPFIWGNHPVRFTGADSCGHVFGATCIQEWVGAATRTPTNALPAVMNSSAATPRVRTKWSGLSTDNESEFDNLSVACAEQLNLSRPQVHRLMREAEQSLHDAVNLSQEQEIHPVESEGESDSLRFPPNLKDITLREHANDFTTDLLSRLRLYTATYTPSNGELYRHFERTCEAYGTDGHPTFWCNEWPQICSTLKDLRLQAARISGNSPRVRWVKRTAVPSMAGVLGRELER
ncbi:hypothetical protein E8E11_006069 [Didymella keratinophila]|nr:hypothetical protein E8E11_006069 [Didymella keratinophila]